MESIHPHILHLIQCIDAEEKEETQRYKLDQQHTLKSLKAEGLALHPIQVTHKHFGYGDYPEISFRLPYPCEVSQFRDGVAIECFYRDEEAVKGVLLSMDGKKGEFRLFAPDFPDWLEEEGVGIKRAPDQRSTGLMKQAIRELPQHPALYTLFTEIHDGNGKPQPVHALPEEDLPWVNRQLNASQQQAVKAVVANERLTILHGPPGTGKATTLIEAIGQLVKRGEKVLVSAPSNTAVDNIAKGLLARGIALLRVGNSSKIDEALLPHTPEGRLSDRSIQKEIKDLKKRAEEFRKMALQYKRRFGRAEREQRNLLFKEVKNIRNEIRKMLSYHEEKLYTQAQVILGTPIGLLDSHLQKISFQTLVIDEAAQCLEPLAWCIFSLAPKYVLAGDPYQLPPTVLSAKAEKMGFNRSILEVCFKNSNAIYLLNTQYRMREAIAGFSSEIFYNNELQTPGHLKNTGMHITFYDTAGAGHEEEQGANGSSLINQGELDMVEKIMLADALPAEDTALISPYSGQVALAKEQLKNKMRISTIDSFQGQEYHTVIVSLVRSNDEGQIGFLNDTRRMNVALTRAKENLFIIGDSATLGKHPFYRSLLEYVERVGSYKSVWELV
ncbi:MAG: AAA family ATPase [Chitinophagaceae bacterium]|nr:AAA family ATPase [Chitinophagaceae bacterium]